MKYKCAHCQKVHYDDKWGECDQIKALRTFCGDDEYQEYLQQKKETVK